MGAPVTLSGPGSPPSQWSAHAEMPGESWQAWLGEPPCACLGVPALPLHSPRLQDTVFSSDRRAGGCFRPSRGKRVGRGRSGSGPAPALPSPPSFPVLRGPPPPSWGGPPLPGKAGGKRALGFRPGACPSLPAVLPRAAAPRSPRLPRPRGRGPAGPPRGGGGCGRESRWPRGPVGARPVSLPLAPLSLTRGARLPG